MTEFFVANSMDGIRMRVSFKDVVAFRKETIKLFANKRDWEVYLFDYHQNYIGRIYRKPWQGESICWTSKDSLLTKRVTKDGRLYKRDR